MCPQTRRPSSFSLAALTEREQQLRETNKHTEAPNGFHAILFFRPSLFIFCIRREKKTNSGKSIASWGGDLACQSVGKEKRLGERAGAG